MPRKLPPLEMFRFFEAAARHLSFTRAAEEMHVTHGAVSQRIKRLEEHLGTPLFRRGGRSVQLTDEGRRLLERVRAAISEITEGVEAIRPNNTDRILTISTTPCLAAYWLLPRLADFNEQHPDIQMNVHATLTRIFSFRRPLAASASPWCVHRSSKRTWHRDGWSVCFRAACPRGTRPSSSIRRGRRASEKSKCSSSGCSSKPDLSNARTPSSLKPLSASN